MSKLSKILQPVGILCILGAFGLAMLYLFVAIAASLGVEQPFFYFQRLKLPAFAVALPVVGILSLLPLALRLAFERKEEVEGAEPEKPRGAAGKGRIGYRLKTA